MTKDDDDDDDRIWQMARHASIGQKPNSINSATVMAWACAAVKTGAFVATLPHKLSGAC